jgi:hypothetical protein
MAGMLRLPFWKFIALDAGGALLWAGSYSAVGWTFRGQLEILADSLGRFGIGLGGIFAIGLALYIGMKYVERKRIYRALRIARIALIELKARMDAGEDLTIVEAGRRQAVNERARFYLTTAGQSRLLITQDRMLKVEFCANWNEPYRSVY